MPDPGCGTSRGSLPPLERDAFVGLLASARATMNEISRRDMLLGILARKSITARQYTTLLALFQNDLLMMDVARTGARVLVNPSDALGYGAQIQNTILRQDYINLLAAQQ
jgi:hypothetical protein